MSGRLSRRGRHERIIAALRARPTVRISGLADEFGVSTETVRRDIDHLSQQGLVDRTYGGAAVRPAAEEPGVSVRHFRMVDERMRIASRAAALVAAGETLMIDAGAFIGASGLMVEGPTDAAPDDGLRNALAGAAVAVHLAEATPAADAS